MPKPFHPIPRRGLSIVELMVGITIGLFILAGATMVMTTQLGDNRRLLLEVQVQQDMRTAVDLIARDVRRAGYWAKAFNQVWPDKQVPMVSSAVVNPYLATTPADAPGTTAATSVSYSFSRNEEEGNQIGTDDNVVTSDEVSGFRLSPGTPRTVDVLLGASGWQALTDPGVLTVTEFSIELHAVHLPMPCGVQCPVIGPGGCPLMQSTRDVTITLVAQAASDASVKRSLRDNIRLRNDVLIEVCAP
jgi:type IV pilus assembly protein PilW